MFTADYTYTNKANPFNVVKFDLDGNFVIIGDDVSDAALLEMENMHDVEGWTCD